MSKAKSLYSEYAKGVLILFLLLGLPLFYYGTVALQAEQKKDSLATLAQQSNHIYQILEHDTYSRLQALEQSARQIGSLPREQWTREEFEFAISGIPGIAWAGLAGLDGKVIVATDGLLEGADISTRPWFSNGKLGPAVADRHEAILLASKLPAREDPYKFIDLSVPVKSRSGELLAVAALHVDWTWYEKQFPYLLGLKTPESKLSYLVVGRDNKIRLYDLGANIDEGQVDAMLAQASLPDDSDSHYWISQAKAAPGSYLSKLGWKVLVFKAKNPGLVYQTFGGMLALIGLVVGALGIALFSWFRFRAMSRQVDQHLSMLGNDAQYSWDAAEQRLPSELLPVMRKIRNFVDQSRSSAKQLKTKLDMAESSFTEINTLIRQAPVAIAMFDRDMKYLISSGSWNQTYLKSDSDPHGQCHYDLIPNIPEDWKKYHQMGLSGKRIQKSSDHWVMGTGKSVWLDWTIEPVYGKQGEVSGIIIVTQDRTQEILAKEALRTTQERFDLAMKGSTDGLYDWNVSTDELYYSPRYKEMLGYLETELPNTFDTWQNQLHPEEKDEILQEVQRVIFDSDLSNWSMTFRLRHKAGHWIPILSRGLILRDTSGKPLRVVGTHLDRTEVDTLNRELEQARVQALSEAKANEAKSRFLATISHEIRNPMNAIAGFARLMKDEADNPKVKNYAELLSDTTESLRLILNDILDFAKIEASKLEIIETPFDLVTMMESLTQSARLQCGQKQVAFNYTRSVGKDSYVLSDPTRLRQICQNLLSNAIKFTDRGSVNVFLGISEPNATGKLQVSIRITDTGIGMKRESLGELFKPFSQVHQRQHTDFGGTGLGLSIVKGLVEALGGQVAVSSDLGIGTSFTLTLELTPANREVPKQATNLPVCPEGPKKVMVVDDMPVNSRIIDAFLSKRGHVVVTFNDSIKATEALEAEQFDVAILDLNMPGVDGLEMARRIRKKESASRNSHLICMTGNVLSETVTEVMLAGFDNFCAKPVDFDYLEQLVCYTSKFTAPEAYATASN